MVVNFRTRGINRGTRKLIRTPIYIYIYVCVCVCVTCYKTMLHIQLYVCLCIQLNN
jgi:hypothetical protein